MPILLLSREQMKMLHIRMKQYLGCLGWSLVLLLLAGCQSVGSEELNPKHPFVFPGQGQPPPATPPESTQPPMAASRPEIIPPKAPKSASAPAPSPVEYAAAPKTAQPAAASSDAPAPIIPSSAGSAYLRAGDLVIVDFYDLPAAHAIPEYRDRIRDDGKLSLPHNISVQAANKTVGQLQEAIQNAYVPSLFVRLSVSVKTEERFFYVGGEVRSPSRPFYQGEMTVLRAIDTVGGFTDFANRSNIELRRANGEKLKVNWNKAMKDPKLDPPVYPNDQITVHKKWW